MNTQSITLSEAVQISAKRYLVKALLPELTIDDLITVFSTMPQEQLLQFVTRLPDLLLNVNAVLASIEAFTEAELDDFVFQMPDKVADRILALSQPVQLVMVDPSDLEPANAG